VFRLSAREKIGPVKGACNRLIDSLEITYVRFLISIAISRLKDPNRIRTSDLLVNSDWCLTIAKLRATNWGEGAGLTAPEGQLFRLLADGAILLASAGRGRRRSPNRGAAERTRSLVMQFDDAVQRAGMLRLVPGRSLFRTAQPRKLCVEDGDGFGGGFASRRGWWDGLRQRGRLGAPKSLVAAEGSAAPRSQAA